MGGHLVFFFSIAHLEIAQRGKNKTRLNKQLRNVVYTTRNTLAKKKEIIIPVCVY